MSRDRVSQALIRIAAVVFIAAAVGACSDVPEWMGGDPAPAQPASTTDTSAPTADNTVSQGTTVAEASDQYPVLADTPSKAPSTTSSDEQKQVANGLVADRTQAQYSAEALQAGNVPAAAPPPPASAESSEAIPPPDTAPTNATPAPSATSTPPPAPAPARAAAAEPAGRSPMPGTLPAEGESSAPAAEVASAAPSVSPAPMPPPAAGPAAAPAAMPPPPRVAAAMPSVAADDAALGFQPSHAPPLDPAVAQLMGNRAPVRGQRFASLNTSAAPAPMFRPTGTPTAVVQFSANTIALDPNGVAQVQAAVAAYKAAGGQGYVRVVGHSASGAPTLSADKQMTQSLQRSQACATAVARELIKEGVPANRVLVDAAASLSDGEQRRAEIFLQS